MKNKTAYLAILLGFALGSCSLSNNIWQGKPTATSTPLPTASLTPAPTATSTPAPLPGKIMIVVNDELLIHPADNAHGEKLMSSVIPQSEFNKAFPAIGEGSPRVSSFLSPDGTKIAVVTCTVVRYDCQNYSLYIGTVDLKTKVKLDAFKGGLVAWSPTSNQVLIQVERDEMKKQIVSARAEDFGATTPLPPTDVAVWSFDGKQIYFHDSAGWHTINSDGTGKQDIQCDLCALAPPKLSSYAVAQSPDGLRVGIGYQDGTVIIVNSQNFSDIRLGNAGGYITRMFWSPDSQRLAVNVDTTTSQSDIIIIAANGLPLETVPRPEGVNFTILCGWSPDSGYIDYLTIEKKGFNLFLHKLGAPASIQRLTIETGEQNCPIWIP